MFSTWLRRMLTMSAVVALVLPSAALANQGGHFRGAGFDAGSRASITGTAGVPSNGGVIATVRAQSSTTDPNGGLYQIGHIKEGASFTSDCGTNTIGFMAERRAVGGAFLCNAIFGVFGSNHKFSALHVSGAGWEGFIDGVKNDGPYALGFTSGYAYAVAEYNGGVPTSYSMTWGPSGFTPWEYTLDGTTWNTVDLSSTFNDGGWIIGGTPSPFTISR